MTREEIIKRFADAARCTERCANGLMGPVHWHWPGTEGLRRLVDEALAAQAAAHGEDVRKLDCIVVAAREVAMRYPWNPDDSTQRAAFYHAVEQLQSVFADVAK